MNILKIEQKVNQVASAVCSLGSGDAANAMCHANEIIAEIRHYCQSKAALPEDQRSQIEDRLLGYLKKFHE